MTEKRAEPLLAAGIIATDRFSHHDDPLTVGIVQVGVLGVLALIAACCFETPRLPQTGMEWGMVLALAIVCTGFGFTLQPVAQSHTSAERAGLFCALRHAVRRGAAPRKDHAAGCGGHPADPVQPAAAPFDERKEIT